MPPSTIFRLGLIFRMAPAAAIVISANIIHSGSIWKSQCDRLFGSFHSITASTMVPREVPQCYDVASVFDREVDVRMCLFRNVTTVLLGPNPKCNVLVP